MVKLIRQGKTNPLVRETALKITRFLPPKKWEAEARAIHKFVRDQIRYIRDIDGIETIAEADKILQYGQGDCDDKVILAASLLQAIGHPVRLVAVGFNNGPLSHVYLETLLGDPKRPESWVPLELTENLPFGTYPPNITSYLIEYVPMR